jgi:hypothetical protein
VSTASESLPSQATPTLRDGGVEGLEAPGADAWFGERAEVDDAGFAGEVRVEHEQRAGCRPFGGLEVVGEHADEQAAARVREQEDAFAATVGEVGDAVDEGAGFEVAVHRDAATSGDTSEVGEREADERALVSVGIVTDRDDKVGGCED